MSEETRKTVEEDWEYWQPIVAPNGVVDVEQVKKELSDYSYLGSQVSQVYCHITGGLLGKIMYEANTICNYADAHYAKDVEDHEKDLREEFAAAEEVYTAELSTLREELARVTRVNAIQRAELEKVFKQSGDLLATLKAAECLIPAEIFQAHESLAAALAERGESEGPQEQARKDA